MQISYDFSVNSRGNSIPKNEHVSIKDLGETAKNPYICGRIAYIREFYILYFIPNYFLTGKAAPLSNFRATCFK